MSASSEVLPALGRHGIGLEGGDCELAADRVRRAARTDCPPMALEELAQDPEILVRATVALNAGCHPEVDVILARDADERIRALLGGRIAQLLPALDAGERSAAADHVNSMLMVLAKDQAVRVRAAIAEEIAAAASAPRDLVLRLAWDGSAEVSDRVVRLSPVLSDADLLALLATPPVPSTAASIASRSTLSAAVADTIAQHADGPTIRALLSNQSACIRESTLDALVGRAPTHVDWHGPLVRRPRLSAKAVRALSDFIASDLLALLATRDDLESGELDLIRERLAARSRGGGGGHGAVARAQILQAQGGLDEAAVQEAIRRGDDGEVLGLLAVSSGVSLQMLERILERRSAKALVSLVWRSGFGMGLALAIQKMLCRFGPDAVIHPAEDGGFPLTESEMMWQLELLGLVARQGV
ncbi:MAG: DUF2336 domain-containing protein [Acetobacteraceae bacterium]|nr:DUF2336 domain-containing protein [Acetobacteraceae bacterium]